MNVDVERDGVAVERVILRLLGYAQGLGLDGAMVREIVKRVVADMPVADDVDRQAEARHAMLKAARGF